MQCPEQDAYFMIRSKLKDEVSNAKANGEEQLATNLEKFINSLDKCQGGGSSEPKKSKKSSKPKTKYQEHMGNCMKNRKDEMKGSKPGDGVAAAIMKQCAAEYKERKNNGEFNGT